LMLGVGQEKPTKNKHTYLYSYCVSTFNVLILVSTHNNSNRKHYLDGWCELQDQATRAIFAHGDCIFYSNYVYCIKTQTVSRTCIECVLGWCYVYAYCILHTVYSIAFPTGRASQRVVPLSSHSKKR
jgi:hypothetical protein